MKIELLVNKEVVPPCDCGTERDDQDHWAVQEIRELLKRRLYDGDLIEVRINRNI